VTTIWRRRSHAYGRVVTVGRYEIVGELGRGGMATVYLARQIELDRLAALKELGALRSSDPSFARRFLREAQLAGSLSDPNIVTVYDYFEDGGTPYIAMEYLEHGSLRPHVGRMSLAQIGGVLQSVLAGLAAAERRRIVHRDLKPENLLVTSEGRVKIADFGIAKATNDLRTATALTSTGVAIGTPNYMAPEQATAQEVGPWTDLYSVGMMAFEFFVGHAPFADTENPLGVMLRQVSEDTPAVDALDPTVDPRLSRWVGRMVAKDPADRPASAAAAWDELEDTLIGLLGARWQREAPLTLSRTAAASGLFVEPPTAPLAERRLQTTVPPRAVTQAAPISSPRRNSHLFRTTASLVVAATAVIAAAAALVARSGGTAAPAPVATPTTLPAQTTVARPTPTSLSSAPATTTTTAAVPATPVDQRRPLVNEAKSARTQARRYAKAAAQIARLSGARVAGSPTARLAAAMRATAADYRAAEVASTAGDRPGYDAALGRAAADRATVTQALADLRAATKTSTAPRQPSPPPVAQSPCSGDSVSDDPSDESC
jgi:serine/threonine protein kinase